MGCGGSKEPVRYGQQQPQPGYPTAPQMAAAPMPAPPPAQAPAPVQAPPTIQAPPPAPVSAQPPPPPGENVTQKLLTLSYKGIFNGL